MTSPFSLYPAAGRIILGANSLSFVEMVVASKGMFACLESATVKPQSAPDPQLDGAYAEPCTPARDKSCKPASKRMTGSCTGFARSRFRVVPILPSRALYSREPSVHRWGPGNRLLSMYGAGTGRRPVVGRVRSSTSLLGPRTSISSNVQRAGNSSLRRPHCRRVLRLGPAQDIAHSFFAHFESLSARGGSRPMSTALNGQQPRPPA